MATASAIPVGDSKTAREKNKLRVAGKAATKAAKVPGNSANAARKANGKAVEKTVRACACGCGEETMSYFVPGHDARYKGWIKRLADGRIDASGKDAKTGEKVISAKVLGAMGLKKTKDGAIPTVHYNGDKLGKA
jgi:hypothetical protein